MYKIVDFSHHLIQKFYHENEVNNPIFIDATCGMGNDTLHIAKLLNNNGTIIAYDIQDIAIKNTKELLELHHFNNVIYKKMSHENISEENINLVIYNLGYLPGHDKTITTNASSTITSITQVLDRVANDYLIIIVVYPGHSEGEIESKLIDDFCYNLPSNKYLVCKYLNYNRPKAPYILTISKNILK